MGSRSLRIVWRCSSSHVNKANFRLRDFSRSPNNARKNSSKSLPESVPFSELYGFLTISAVQKISHQIKSLTSSESPRTALSSHKLPINFGSGANRLARLSSACRRSVFRGLRIPFPCCFIIPPEEDHTIRSHSVCKGSDTCRICLVIL